MSAQCINYTDECASCIYGVHAVSSKHPLTLTHQPTLQYNITRHNGRKLHDVKMTYPKERYMKNTPIISVVLLNVANDVKTMLGQREALE